ncbi:Uncharacterized protein F52C9.3 [Toxocara canis]|uniref:Uncharacterized protein F52C9.3 n=1 Tax=Toxocara canis TaxID=6265 RepID=A0A0B2VEV9_TOXCA|nr:Uncharacterized protein F52C9.3 [Toxocara canis]
MCKQVRLGMSGKRYWLRTDIETSEIRWKHPPNLTATAISSSPIDAMVAEKIAKVGKTLWEHKKKTAAGFVALYFIARYLERNRRDAKIRSAYCREAVKYGFRTISPEDRPRRVTVLVNVYANDRYAFDNFKMNALPLLNLAGLEVNVIKEVGREKVLEDRRVVQAGVEHQVVPDLQSKKGPFSTKLLRSSPRDAKIRSAYCREAVKYGFRTISPEDRPRRVTVLVNVYANDRYAFDNFKMNALPLLNLAGLEVNVIKAEDEEQMEAISAAIDSEEADALYIVGGDGTISRVLTGIYRNRENAVLPIGIFPGGNENRFLKGVVPQESFDENEHSKKPVYGLSGIFAGWFLHMETKKKKLWYWGALKRRFAYFWEMLKRYPDPMELSLTYDEYCPGCNKCRTPLTAQVPQWRWWHALVGAPKYKVEGTPSKDYSSITNANCGEKHEMSVKTKDLYIEHSQQDDTSMLRVRAGGERLGRWGVMRDGWKRCKADVVDASPDNDFYETDLNARSVRVSFSVVPDFIRRITVFGDEKKLEGELENKKVKLEATNRKITVQSDVRRFCESAMALIEDRKREISVARCDLESFDENEHSKKPVYGLSGIFAGWFLHMETKKKKLWYWGALKRRFAYFWEMLKRYPDPMELSLTYDEYCPGCNKCRTPLTAQVPQWRWWHALVGAPKYKVEGTPSKDYSSITNANCGEKHEMSVKTKDLYIEHSQQDDTSMLRVRAGGERLGRWGVMRDGWKRCKADVVDASPDNDFYETDLNARSVRVSFSVVPDFIRRITVFGDEKKLEGELENKKVKLEATNRKISIFLPSELRWSLEEIKASVQ